MSQLDDLKKEIESELWAALNALEEGDIIGVRQCAARAQSGANEAWRASRKESEAK